ncbi:hypothetical protein D3C79_1086540 [compost metagenome]
MLIERHEAVAIAKDSYRAVVDQDLAFGKAVADYRHLLQVTGIEIAVLELANGVERLQVGNALFQAHSADLALGVS